MEPDEHRPDTPPAARRKLLLAVGAGLLVVAGAIVLATRDPQAFFDGRTVTGIGLMVAGALGWLVFDPLRPAKARAAGPRSWKGPAAIIALLVVAMGMGAALVFAERGIVP